MCYFLTHMPSKASTVGVRELRQNLSKYLTRVKEGESLVVTERGEEVAKLIPSGPALGPYAVLVEKFGATVPTASLEEILADLHDSSIEPSPAGTADAILAEGRRERI